MGTECTVELRRYRMQGKQVCVIDKSSDKDEKAIIDFMNEMFGVKCWVEVDNGKRSLMTTGNPDEGLNVINAVFDIGTVLNEIKGL